MVYYILKVGTKVLGFIVMFRHRDQELASTTATLTRTCRRSAEVAAVVTAARAGSTHDGLVERALGPTPTPGIVAARPAPSPRHAARPHRALHYVVGPAVAQPRARLGRRRRRCGRWSSGARGGYGEDGKDGWEAHLQEQRRRPPWLEQADAVLKSQQ